MLTFKEHIIIGVETLLVIGIAILITIPVAIGLAYWMDSSKPILDYDYAYISIGEEVISGNVSSCTKTDGDMYKITIDGETYVVDQSNVILHSKES